MRTLTKTGIRMLSAKYRSILIKCAIINASVFIGAFGGIQNAMSASWYVHDWAGYKDAINDDVSGHPNIDTIYVQPEDGANSITYQDIPSNINRTLSILGYPSVKELNGANTYQGLTVDTDGILTLTNITMKNFNGLSGVSGAIYNSGITNIISQNGGSITFSNNTGMMGSAIVSERSSTEGENSRPLHINAKGGNINFIENSAYTLGGGLFVFGAADVIAENNDIIFNGNTALMGGSIAFQSVEEFDKMNIVAMNNDIVFKNNTAQGEIPDDLLFFIPVNGGGAMLVQSGQADIIAKNGKIEFQNNSTTGFGGAILGLDYGGDVKNKINIVAENNDIIFSGNTADFGGGAIANIGELNIKAKAGHTVEFATATDSIANVSALDKDSLLTINDADSGYTGDVILQDVVSADLTGLDDMATPGNMVIGGGRVFAKGNIEQSNITVKSGATLSSTTDDASIVANDTFTNAGTVNMSGDSSKLLAVNLNNNGTIDAINVVTDDSLTNNNTINATGIEVAELLTNNETMDAVNLLATRITNNGNIITTDAKFGYATNYLGASLTLNGKVNSGISPAIFENGGEVTINGDAEKRIQISNLGTVNFNGKLDAGNSVIQLVENDGGIMNFSTNAIESTANLPISVFYLNGGSVNIADGRVNTLHVDQLKLTRDTNFAMDADLAAESMDKIQIHDFTTSTFEEGKVININKINLLSDANDDYVELSLFADDNTKTLLANNVSGNLNGLKYSSIYKYDALYNPETGMIGFTRYESGTSDDFNPYLYAPSVAAQTTANITGQIATLVMDKMDDVVHAQGRSGGDTPSSANAWVKVMGLDDNVEFQDFDTIDSKALTVAGGFNTDKITCGDCGAVFGVYAGYIGGKQQYTDNDTDQDGGYVGLSSALTLGNAFLTATVNGGLLKNKSTNMYGTDEFKTLWLGTGLKTGYNYAINDSVVLQPNVYGGYTLVNTQDYTSVSGVKIANSNLNFFEIDPGLKLSAIIADGWTGSVQGKYAIVMDNGGDITANDIILQNISTKNYFEYGIGIDKSLTDAFYLGVKINRRDGGRTGWNGSIEFRYKF